MDGGPEEGLQADDLEEPAPQASARPSSPPQPRVRAGRHQPAPPASPEPQGEGPASGHHVPTDHHDQSPPEASQRRCRTGPDSCAAADRRRTKHGEETKEPGPSPPAEPRGSDGQSSPP